MDLWVAILVDNVNASMVLKEKSVMLVGKASMDFQIAKVRFRSLHIL